MEIRKALEQKHWLLQWLALMLILVALVWFGVYREGYIASEFIYQQY